MFATLDPTSRRLRLPYEQEVIINDTVGFIRDLPETLVAAFRATLEEISDSDLLVHVVDASNPGAVQQIASVDKILKELKLNEVPQILVLNKQDLTDEQTIETLTRQINLDHDVEIVTASAVRRESLKSLVEHIAARIGSFTVEEAGDAFETAA
jgi:GTP-binding protein HflX